MACAKGLTSCHPETLLPHGAVCRKQETCRHVSEERSAGSRRCLDEMRHLVQHDHSRCTTTGDRGHELSICIYCPIFAAASIRCRHTDPDACPTYLVDILSATGSRPPLPHIFCGRLGLCPIRRDWPRSADDSPECVSNRLHLIPTVQHVRARPAIRIHLPRGVCLHGRGDQLVQRSTP